MPGNSTKPPHRIPAPALSTSSSSLECPSFSRNRRPGAGSMTNADVPRFGFGSNFLDYQAKQFDEERVAISRRTLLGFLDLESLRGKRMIDIGCGPGLTSLVAYRAEVAELFSFDYD